MQSLVPFFRPLNSHSHLTRPDGAGETVSPNAALQVKEVALLFLLWWLLLRPLFKKKQQKKPSLQPKVVLGLPVTSYSNLMWTQQKAQLDIAQKVLLLLIETHMVTQPCSISLYRRLGTGLTCYSHFQTEIHPLWGKENSSFRNSVLQYHGSGCLLSEHNIGNTCSVRHSIWAHVAVLLGLIPLCATILCPYSAFVFYFNKIRGNRGIIILTWKPSVNGAIDSKTPNSHCL